MRTKLVAGNWKMNLTGAEGEALVNGFVERVTARPDIDVVVCPSFLAIPRLKPSVQGTHVKLGAQNVHWLTSGAYTGQISPTMLMEYGVDFCIVGHSETRGRFGKLDISETAAATFAETDETVALKVRALMDHSITPILCVGETLAERQAGNTDEVVAEQLKGALQHVHAAEMYTFVVAYEPVWAIGTGETCDTPEAQRVCAHVRAEVARLFEPEVADHVRVLYGGSVKPGNAHELFAETDIDGALVGGASLKADDFSAIVQVA